MSMLATLILDSGCFLCDTQSGEPHYSEVGYFCCDKSSPDIRVYIDGSEKITIDLKKIVKNSLINVVHRKADGNPYTDGVEPSKTYRGRILKMKRDLYDEDIEVKRDYFDYILHFDSGEFRDSMVKKRAFKEHKKQTDGTYKHTDGYGRKEVGPIAHNVAVNFTLKDGESLELESDGKILFTSKDYKTNQQLVIEVLADNSTADKFYRECFKHEKESCWMPNQGDPPPVCPYPPCPPDNGASTGGG